MSVQIPKPLNKLSVARDIAASEKVKGEANQISTAFKDHVIDCWDLNGVKTSELCALHEKLCKQRHSQTSLVLIHLKKN